MIVIMHLLGTI